MHQKINNWFIIIGFAMVIVLPLIFFDKNATESVSENRVLSTYEFSSFRDLLDVNKIQEFESYFDDHIGGRDQLCTMLSELQYVCFKELPNNIIRYGKNGEWYYDEGNSIERYQKKLPADVTWANEYALRLNKLDEYYKSKGAQLIWMMNPDKQTIYPEDFIEGVNVIGKTDQFDVLTDAIINNTSVHVVNTEDVLYKNRFSQYGRVFWSKVDVSHWNHVGAYMAYEELMRTVQQLDPTVTKCSVDYQKDFFVNNLNPVTRTGEMSYRCTVKNASEITVDQNVPPEVCIGDDSIYWHYENTSHPEYPKVLIFGDSYIYSFMMPYLAESFSEIVEVPYTNGVAGDWTESLLGYYNPDYVIYECAEHMFDADMINMLPSE